MNSKTIYVGLDYHKNSVQVCAIDKEERVWVNQGVANDWEAIVGLVARLGVSASDTFAAIEACSGAANLADELVTRGNWSVDLAHPGYVARLKTGVDKSDFTDARLLADLERVGYVPVVWQPPHYIVDLRRLVNHRRVLANHRRNLKLRIGALLRDQRILHAPYNPWSKLWRQWLEDEAPVSEQSRWIIGQNLRLLDAYIQEIKQAEDRISKYTRDDPVVAALRDEFCVGAVTAAVLRAHIGRFDRFHSGKQLARFCGTSPRNVSSGQRQATAGLVPACDRYLRSTLIETAHRLRRHDARWSKLAASLERKGKPHNVIIAAIANRWIRRLYHRLKPLGIAC